MVYLICKILGQSVNQYKYSLFIRSLMMNAIRGSENPQISKHAHFKTHKCLGANASKLRKEFWIIQNLINQKPPTLRDSLVDKGFFPNLVE